jgi:hypothetical protein
MAAVAIDAAERGTIHDARVLFERARRAHRSAAHSRRLAMSRRRASHRGSRRSSARAHIELAAP